LSNLVIVESPTKAKTIKNFLGKDFEVIASKGHLRDLPKSTFGIKIEDDAFIPEYKVQRDHSKVLKEIKDLAKDADTIYIATDEDREGEAIGYHIACAIKKDPTKLPRIVFHEITKSAIQNAIKNPKFIDMNSVDAQQARRLLDRIVGYRLSPLLASKIQRGLSAGRVQSSSLKIIVDKEKEIQNFKPVEYWSIDAIFDEIIESILIEYKNEKISKLTITNKQDANIIKQSILNDTYIVHDIESKVSTTKSPAPFMTSSLQQTASSLISFSPKKTMMLAQKLYEGVKTPNGVIGVITYMRTDSLNIAKSAILAARDHIKSSYGDSYLPKNPKFYTTKSKGAQEAHEAIRPTIIEFTPQIAKEYLDNDTLKLYTLIYNRFIASQMNDAKFETQNIIFAGSESKFKASGRKLVFDGFYKVLQTNSQDKLLPKLTKGDSASLTKLNVKQNFTQPPARFTEASLIKQLEALGIGRPSTYAPTISILQSRKYIEIKNRSIFPTKVAFTVIEMLEKHFYNIVDSTFTSEMESSLDKIASGTQDWQTVLKEFYFPFMDAINSGKKNIKSQKIVIPTGENCPQCEHELVKRQGRYGEFIACSNFPKCKYVKNDKVKKEVVTTGVICPECKSKELVQRNSKRGVFYGCMGYPKCRFILNFEPVQQTCPKCEYTIMVKSDDKVLCPKCDIKPKPKKTKKTKK
jgi:DNA topoisomerase-1